MAHVSIETTRSHQSRIQHIRSVGNGKHHDVLLSTETVPSARALVERRFALVVAAKVATLSTTLTDSVDLVDKDDARSVLLGVGKQVSHSAGTDTTNISTNSEPETDRKGT